MRRPARRRRRRRRGASSACARAPMATERRHVAHHGQHRALGGLRAPRRRRAGRRAPSPRRSAPGRRARRAARSAPRRRRGSSCERITPLLPRAPSSAARATDSTISSRPISSIELLALGVREAVDLVEAGAQRERHVVARVAVGDREDVEVVDLLRGATRGARARPRRRRGSGRGWARGGTAARREPARRALDGLDDLAGLQAARADVDALRRRRRGPAPSGGSGRSGAASPPSSG